MMPTGVIQVDKITQKVSYANPEIKSILGDMDGLKEQLSLFNWHKSKKLKKEEKECILDAECQSKQDRDQ